jgi:hypothetical protein
MANAQFTRDEITASVVIVEDGRGYKVIVDQETYCFAPSLKGASVMAYQAYDELQAEDHHDQRHVLFNNDGEFYAVSRKQLDTEA